MVRRPHETPAWRVFGATLGAFAIVVQLLMSALFIVQAAAAGNPAGLSEADLSVICTHDPAAIPDDGGGSSAPHPHGQCPACACPQSAKLLAPLPTSPILVVLRPQAQTQPALAGRAVAKPTSPSPYAPPAPPVSA